MRGLGTGQEHGVAESEDKAALVRLRMSLSGRAYTCACTWAQLPLNADVRKTDEPRTVLQLLTWGMGTNDFN